MLDDIRIMASAGWMKAAAIPEEAIPALVEALRDPELQVRANAANALARLDALPAAADSPPHRVHGRCRRRPADERGDGAQAGPVPTRSSRSCTTWSRTRTRACA